MKLIVFDLYGKYAHFRKFWTNSSSLSYTVPPRTVLIGIVASILDLERDSYYDLFSSDNLYIAVKKMTKVRKIIQSLNYIKAEKPSDLAKFKNHTQVPFEIITSECGVKYRVYLAHNDHQIEKEILDLIKEEKTHFPIYLGAAPFSCKIQFSGVFECYEIKTDDFVEVSTVINMDYVSEKGIKLCESGLFLSREKMPRDFNLGREIKQVSTYIYDENLNPLLVKPIDKVYRVKELDENILFM